jgi:CRP-like cAMP-binding protein
VRYCIATQAQRDVIRSRVNERLCYALSRAALAVPAPRRRVELSQVSEQSRAEEQAQEASERMRVLMHVDFLNPLSEGQKKTLAENAERRMYASSERIISQGDVGDDMFIIERGRVEVSLERGGRRARVAELGPGEFFGEMSLMTGEMRAADVTALTECSLIVVGTRAFHLVIEQNARVLEEISELLSSRHNELAKKASGEFALDRQTQPDLLLDKIRRFFNRSDRPAKRS